MKIWDCTKRKWEVRECSNCEYGDDKVIAMCFTCDKGELTNWKEKSHSYSVLSDEEVQQLMDALTTGEIDEVNEIVKEAEMMGKKVEMIISYTMDGDDYLYNDNHGRLIRCKDCEYYKDIGEGIMCTAWGSDTEEDDYCSGAKVRNESK